MYTYLKIVLYELINTYYIVYNFSHKNIFTILILVITFTITFIWNTK